MYLNTNNVSECCGCTACQQVCPTNCIDMKSNDEGFMYPVIDSTKCIHCHKCESACPFEMTSADTKPTCYAGWNKDAVTRLESTSGGAFSAIVDYAKDNQYQHIWGVAYDANLRAVHCELTDQRGLSAFTRSKYVQSEMGNTYRNILSQLKKDEKVLFSGTPCQVQGLLNAVPPENRQSLLTVALICHGVSSPVMFEAYKREVAHEKQKTIKEFRFRDKKKLDGVLQYNCTTILFEDGTEQIRTDDPYTVCFGRGFMQRESCFFCPFTTVYRNADLTIGDFWGFERAHPELSAEKPKGISLILAHTDKGRKLCSALQKTMVLFEVQVQDVLTPEQEQLIHPARRPLARNRFNNHVLQGGHSFSKEAKKELFLWKIENFCFRIKRKIKNRIAH